MRSPESDPEAAALAEARWAASDLLTRRPAELAPDLLRGRAAELAGSAEAQDRLLAGFLERAADDLEQGRPPLQERALAAEAPPARWRRGFWWAAAALLALLGAGIFAAAGERSP